MKVKRSLCRAFAVAGLMGIGLVLMFGASPDTVRADSSAQEGICERTQQVRDRLLGMIPRVSDCAEVSASDLAGLDHILVLSVQNIEELKAGDFEGLTNLEGLDLSGNELTGLPESIFDGLTNLQALWLTANSLTQLPDGVFSDLTELRGLRLEGNGLTGLPDGIFDNNGKLTELNIWHNQLTELPDDVFTNLTKLRELDLSGNKLRELPDGVLEDLTKLQTLYLSINDLEELPDGVFDNLVKLRVLSLGVNGEVAELAEGLFDGLSALEFLDLQEMSLRELPAGAFDDLSKLQYLNLSRNDLAELPDGIFDKLTSLHTLTLDQNSLTTLPEGPFEGLDNLWHLNLSNNSLNELPDETFDDLSALSVLSLSDNQLTELPDGAFDNLSNLKNLELQRNELTELPDGIGNLSELRELLLYNNEITELPDGMFDSMTNLEVLHMDRSGVTGLPEGIKKLTKLRKLDLGRMEISEVPPGFFDKLTNLQELDLSANNLSDLPAGIFDKLTNLTKLDLGFNEFSDIPAGVFEGASSLEEVGLWGNPGSPFHYFVLLDSLGEDSFNVRMSKPAPFPVTAYLAAVGGQLSETTIDLPMGTTTAETVTVTRDSQGDTPVTVSVRVEIETKWGYRIVSNGVEVSGVRIITDAPQQLGSSQQGSEFHGVCDRTEAVRTAILSELTDIENCADVDANHLRTLHSLELNNSGVTSLKARDFDDLLLLEYLSIADNGLTSLPDGIFSDDLTYLRYLKLNDNELTSLLEDVFDNLAGLRSLDLSSNRLAELPEGVFDNLTNLTSLSLDSNRVGEWPEGVFDNLSSLTSLGLGYNGIEQVPDGLFDGLTALQYLGMAYNDIAELPDGVFDDLTALTNLGLSRNDLTVVPDAVTGLSQLESLNLAENDIVELPGGTFDSLTKLTYLGLFRNRIRALPTGIFDNLGQIETLYISTNKISVLPDGVFDNLTNMERLDIARNLLIELPDGAFDGLNNLQSVRAESNLVRPLVLTAKLERLKDTEVAVMVAEAAPFDVEVNLTAGHGTLSTSTVTVAAGSTRSDSVTLTPSGTEPVTVSMSSARFLTDASDHISGIEIGLGRSLTPSEDTEANQKATGAPVITGTAAVGEKLTASTSTIADANGVTGADFQFYWIRSDGETDSYTRGRGQEYRVSDSDVGKRIKVQVKFTDDANYEETLTSTSTATVPGAVPGKVSFRPDVQPTGAGELSVTWWEPRDGGSPITGYTVQWKETGGSWDTAADVSEATTTETSYTISGLSFSIRYAIRVFATNDFGNGPPSWEAIAIAVARVSDQPNTPATGTASISGTAQVGETLTAETSGIVDSDGLDHVTFTYQWIRDFGRVGLFINKATSSTYLVTADDVGKSIKVRVSFIDDAGNVESLTSAATAAVAAAVPGVPRTLAVERGGTGELDVTWEEPSSNGGSAVTGYTVQWKQASGSWDTAADVSEATVTDTPYTITGLRLQVEYAVRVFATNSAGDGPASAEVKETADAQTSQQQEASENTPATGAPTISGILEAGQSLNADTSSISDADGLTNPTFVYQWLADDAATGEATSSTYTLTESDQGKAIKVRVTFSDDAGNEETLTSTASAAVEAPLTAELQGVPDNHDGSGKFTFRILFSEPVTAGFAALKQHSFQVSNATIKKAQRVDGRNDLRKFTIQPSSDADVILVLPATEDCADDGAVCTSNGKRLSTRLEITVPGPESANSAATGAPTIGGTLEVGQTLTASTSGISDADGLSNVTYSYQWLADDADISGATVHTYTLSDAEEGKAIKVRVSFTDDEGNVEALTSSATTAVEARPNSPATGMPSISGTTQVGGTLTAGIAGIADSEGLDNATFTYQWVADDVDISGATGDGYTLTDFEEGKGIRVRVAFTDDAGNEETLTSAPTAAVAAAPNSPATGQPTIRGSALVGARLRVDTSGIADANGLTDAQYRYQWLTSDDGVDTEIAGATRPSYRLTSQQDGKTIKVRVSFNDDASHHESLTSPALHPPGPRD